MKKKSRFIVTLFCIMLCLTIFMPANVSAGTKNKKVMKYVKGVWYTCGQQPTPTRYVFSTNKVKAYSTDGKILYETYKVKYIKTNYGYYIRLRNNNSVWGFRLVLKGKDADKNILSCIGNGKPYSTAGYSGSSSLMR